MDSRVNKKVDSLSDYQLIRLCRPRYPLLGCSPALPNAVLRRQLKVTEIWISDI